MNEKQRKRILQASDHLAKRHEINKAMDVIQEYFPGLVLKHVHFDMPLNIVRAIMMKMAEDKLQKRWIWQRESVGQGTYGTIMVGTYKDQTIARKISRKKRFDGSFALELAFLDWASKCSFQSPFVVSLKGYHIGKDDVFLDMEYMTSLKQSGVTPRNMVHHIVPIAFQLFAGIAFMHKYRICHSDLKMDNILYDKKSKRLKIIDFGLIHTICDPFMRFSKKVAKHFNETNLIGNYYQMPPEALICSDQKDTCILQKKTCFNSSIDLWNIGVILAELLGTSPSLHVEADTERQAAKSFQILISKLGTITRDEWNKGNFDCSQISMGSEFDNFTTASNTIWKFLEKKYKDNPMLLSLVDLVKQCMAPTPKDRISARAALTHPVFATMRYYYFPRATFDFLCEPWSLREFIQARTEQVPEPVLQKKWATSRVNDIRLIVCNAIKEKYSPRLACQIIYLYDSHCWEQARQSPNQSYMFYFPDGFEEVGVSWVDDGIVQYTPTISSFLEFVSPQRLMGISFLDYAILMGVTNVAKILEVMCMPEFVYARYQENMNWLSKK